MWVIALASGAPRLWAYLLDTALDAFDEGFRRPHDGRISTRIHQGLRVAQATLRARNEALLDRRDTDVSLLALAREGELMHVLAVGGLSAYVYRQRALRRLTNQDSPDGVLKAEPVWCAEPVEPGDVWFAGAASLFTEQTLTELRSALGGDRQIAPEALSVLLCRAAHDGGQSAATLAFRFDAP